MTKLEAIKLKEYCLNDRQIEIMDLLAEGHSQTQVAALLNYGSPQGVHNILRRVKGYAAKKGFNADDEMDVSVPEGYSVKGTSTLYDDTGNVKIRWVKTDADKERQYEIARQSLLDIAETIGAEYKPVTAPVVDDNDLITLYVSNDIHFGALMDKKETGDRDYNLDVAKDTLRGSIRYLVDNSPATKVCIISDLGDMTEMDDYKNATPKSGHGLDVDSRYSKVLSVTVMAMIDMIETALTKHEVVRYINVEGNHDITTALAVRIAVEARFYSESGVIVDNTPLPIKYYKHGTTLLGFAHGDGLKMDKAGETMAVDNQNSFSFTNNRYFHFGHNHKDSVVDGRLCRAESHRNIAPLNFWASQNGFRRQIGTMKSIVYCKTYGEVSRQTFNVAMLDEV